MPLDQVAKSAMNTAGAAATVHAAEITTRKLNPSSQHFDINPYERPSTSVYMQALSVLEHEGKSEHAPLLTVDVQHSSFHLFEVALPRQYCHPDETWQDRSDGKPYDTAKPLAAHGFDLSRTILLDDSERKILPDEKMNGLIVPPFLACSDAGFLEEAEESIEFFGTPFIHFPFRWILPTQLRQQWTHLKPFEGSCLHPLHILVLGLCWQRWLTRAFTASPV